jgi:hypothetical protein
MVSQGITLQALTMNEQQESTEYKRFHFQGNLAKGQSDMRIRFHGSARIHCFCAFSNEH